MTYTRRIRSDSTHSASAVAPLETATVPPSSVTTATIPSSATTTPPSASVIPNTDPFPPCAPCSASHTASTLFGHLRVCNVALVHEKMRIASIVLVDEKENEMGDEWCATQPTLV
ncbi:hypothetical protein ACLB2K_016980 [Fragaria x ananassa]